MALVKVRMIIGKDHPDVHDGEGGQHGHGTSPSLRPEAAAHFVDKGYAVYANGRASRMKASIVDSWHLLAYRDKLSTLSFCLAGTAALFGVLAWALNFAS